MAAALAPGWQTGELDEEWVETSPSPPQTQNSLPAETLTPQTNTSVKAKRGSLRALGHTQARGLPPSRTSSQNGPEGEVGGLKRVLSERIPNGNSLQVPAHLTTRSQSENDIRGASAGTFVVKDGVEDDRGQFLAKNANNAGKGRDMFGPSALEKMFQPPSPPKVSQPPEISTIPEGPGSRKPSHAYAPVNPSRLSKSMTPSTASASTSITGIMDSTINPPLADESGPFDTSLPAGEESQEFDGSVGDQQSVEIPQIPDISPVGKGVNYPFTFTAPQEHLAKSDKNHQPPVFDPSLSPFASGEPSHSTLNGRPGQGSKNSRANITNPALKLFRSTYDTYTREHLSAVVDSIALDASPSPENSPENDGVQRWQDGSPSYSGSGGPSGSSGSRTRTSDDSDARSSKRLRMSPSSPLRQNGGIRDWGAQGRAMMNKIRHIEVESATSASQSLSPGKENHQSYQQSLEYHELPPTPPLAVIQPNGTKHRSNPSTTSSGYLRAAEDIMAKIKARKVSDSSAAPDVSHGTVGGRVTSGTSSEWEMAALAARSLERKVKGKAVGSSPRKYLRRVSGDEPNMDDLAEPGEAGSSDKMRLESRRPVSASSNNPPSGQAVNNEDLNRFVSATTAATATTVSTSFVKHAGPRGHIPGGGIRMIKPDDVLGLVPDKVGKMRFDKTGMKWIRDSLGTLDEAGESRASRSRSEGSEDVFAGMDSWGREASPHIAPQNPGPNEDVVNLDSSDSPSDEDEGLQIQANTTQLLEMGSDTDSDSDSLRSFVERHGAELPQSPPISPPRQAQPSAPPLSTPTPAAVAPKPIRSALRNANGEPAIATPANLKKRTAWHESVTPAPGSSGQARRSVSFSDGKKTGRIVGLHSEDDIQIEVIAREGRIEDDNGRIARIEAMLKDVNKLSLHDGTPSKTRHTGMPPSPDSASSDDPDRTEMPIRSFRSRMAANATFLTECSFGVAHDNLVKLITDVYGSEPWWDKLTVLDLRGKGADSVARLKEFLPDLDDVNLNDNKISYLSGIPAGVRRLQVAGNRLTSLTSVDHLRNLHYLDISRNKLDSVSQLQCLRHLRELRADRNGITDLDGLMAMDSLVRLSVADNKVRKLDLTKAKWQRLESLNLASNQIDEVKGLARLSSLSSLVLENNSLPALRPDWAMTSMRKLQISNNDISNLDLSGFPRIRTVYADHNNLITIDHLEGGSNRLENLSLRNQKRSGLYLTMATLQAVKRLYISGNPLSSEFFRTEPLFSLTYLEAAGCSLKSWPRDFARKLPSLQILNINYNYFENLNGVRGLIGLRKLTAVGGRLGENEAKGVVGGLKGLVNLEEIDLRSNPSTLGFYLPLILPSSNSTSSTDTTPASPPPRQAPLPSVTLATIHPGSIRGDRSMRSKPTDWAALDKQFRKALPDDWYSRRLVYRGLIMSNCPKLRVLDGIRVEDGEKRKSELLLREVSGQVTL